jgi:hypothetical protein
LDLSAAAGLLQGFHAIVAMQRNEPHWLLTDADARRYGVALSNALRHFPVRAAQKSLDFMVLAFIVFEMETPRLAKSAMLYRQTHEPLRPSATVYPFATPQPPQPPRPSPGATSAASSPAFPAGLDLGMMAEPPVGPAE